MRLSSTLAALLTLTLSSAAAAAVTPGTCGRTSTVVTRTVTPRPYVTTMTSLAGPSCYTETTTAFSSNVRCKAFDTATCEVMECFRPETKTVPCADPVSDGARAQACESFADARC
jgi:hypothetical protein